MIIDTQSEDFEKRMKSVRKRAQWELGDERWAGVLVGALLYPKESDFIVSAEKDDY